MIALRGSYSLVSTTPDETVTLDVIQERRRDDAAPDAIVAVGDATNLRRVLCLVLPLRQSKGSTDHCELIARVGSSGKHRY